MTAPTELLNRLTDEGRRAYPELLLDGDDFGRFVMARVEGESDVTDFLKGLSGAEMWLVYGCALGNGKALAAFELAYFREVRLGLTKLRPSEDLVDEVRQSVRMQLFIARDGELPRIAQVVGRGSLRGLLRVMALRAGISLLRKQGKETLLGGEGDLDLLDVPVAGPSTELGLLKAQHRQEFKASLQRALAGLSARQRNLLRMHFIDRVTLPSLAKLYRVDRATITRWISKARREIYAATRQDLQQRLALTQDELTSFIRVIDSCFDVSMHRMLAADTESR